MAKRKSSFVDVIAGYIDELERVANQILESRYPEKPSWDIAKSVLEPLTNVFVTVGEVVITADLPCVNTAAISVKAVGPNVIEIKANTIRKISFSEFGITHRKGEFSGFYSQVSIPVPVDMRKMSITCKRSVLEIRIPRKPTP